MFPPKQQCLLHEHELNRRRGPLWTASAESTFASATVDFIVKPFNVGRLESALDLAIATIQITHCGNWRRPALSSASRGETCFEDVLDAFGIDFTRLVVKHSCAGV